jgi:amidohydrolase
MVAARQVIPASQTIAGRKVSPLDNAVLSIGSVHAGDAFDVIPTTAELSGTVRAYDASTGVKVSERLENVIYGLTSAYGAEAKVEIVSPTPALINDSQVSQTVRRAAEAALEAGQATSGEQAMGSEDAFAIGIAVQTKTAELYLME